MFARLVTGLCLMTLILISLPAQTGAAPTGFTDELVPGLGDLSQPTAFAFLPDGSMLITTKPGQLLRYAGGALSGTPVLDISGRICAQSEQGLLGVAVDPAYDPDVPSSRHIYLYYTARLVEDPAPSNCNGTTPAQLANRANRVSRFTIDSGGLATSETILLDRIASPGANHNGGDLHFGKDGNLYISVGDGGVGGGSNQSARRMNHMLGKILRITKTGGIPAGNPYTGAGTARCYDPADGGNKTGTLPEGQTCQEIFAWGLRNPFRIAFDPNAAGTRFFINDVGQSAVEEISEGRAGADYGWNCFEGNNENSTSGLCPPSSPPDPPFFAYGRSLDGCGSITGGAFVPAGIWPEDYDGAYIFADFNCSRFYTLDSNGSNPSRPPQFHFSSTPTHLAFGPFESTQALYYASFNNGDIRRIYYTGNLNRSPVAAATATPTSGPVPLTVAFNASASSDPDGDAITSYLWDFGDGQTATTAGPTTSHTYASPGAFTATLRVRDSRGATSSNTVSMPITPGNTPPQAQILTPTAGSTFVAGQTITISGSASDAEDGALAASRLSWEVRRHHAEHYHPYHSANGVAGSEFVAPGPEDLSAVDNSYLEIRLTATDSLGSSTVVTRELRPEIVTLSFTTDPPGLRLIVDGGTVGNTVTAPATVRSWPGFELSLSAPEGQEVDGVPVCLTGWQHGGAAAQTLVTPDADASYTAIFEPATDACPALTQGELLYLPLVSRP